jgi:hypothetical protein
MHVTLDVIVLLFAFVIQVPVYRVTAPVLAPVEMASIVVPETFNVVAAFVPNFLFSGDDDPQILPAVPTHVPSAIVPPSAAGAGVCVE